jgi:hypothetical protein
MGALTGVTVVTGADVCIIRAGGVIRLVTIGRAIRTVPRTGLGDVTISRILTAGVSGLEVICWTACIYPIAALRIVADTGRCTALRPGIPRGVSTGAIGADVTRADVAIAGAAIAVGCPVAAPIPVTGARAALRAVTVIARPGAAPTRTGICVGAGVAVIAGISVIPIAGTVVADVIRAGVTVGGAGDSCYYNCDSNHSPNHTHHPCRGCYQRNR